MRGSPEAGLHVAEGALTVLQGGKGHGYGHKLRPGNFLVRPKGTVLIAGENAQAGQGFHRPGIPGGGLHIGEGPRLPVHRAQQLVEHGGRLCPGDGFLRQKQAAFIARDIGHMVLCVQQLLHVPAPPGGVGHVPGDRGGLRVHLIALLVKPAQNFRVGQLANPRHQRRDFSLSHLLGGTAQNTHVKGDGIVVDLRIRGGRGRRRGGLAGFRVLVRRRRRGRSLLWGGGAFRIFSGAGGRRRGPGLAGLVLF